MQSDAIVALATYPSTSALALIRLSGPTSHDIVQKLSQTKIEIRKATHANLYDANQLLDDVIVTLWQKPSSYTGEDMAEISCHGNMLIVEKIIRACVSHGARQALPGEFTQRAFLHGKIDLTQAEAVLDLIHAKSERALRAAQKVKEGRFGQILMEHRQALIDLLAHLEAYIDFPEEDINPEVGQLFLNKIISLQQAITRLLNTADEGRKLREGMRVALIGAPNAGKSSLLNALLGLDRAIVSDQPGTTRDTVEEVLMLEGIAIRLIDTAGLHETDHTVEKLGIERTWKTIESADLVLHLVDPSQTNASHSFSKQIDVITCLTKSDLTISTSLKGLKISVVTGEGLAELKQEIVQRLKLAEFPENAELVAINTRHEILLRQAYGALEKTKASIDKHLPPELTSSDLRQALHSIGEIAGEATNEDILNSLFKTFCIGK